MYYGQVAWTNGHRRPRKDRRRSVINQRVSNCQRLNSTFCCHRYWSIQLLLVLLVRLKSLAPPPYIIEAQVGAVDVVFDSLIRCACFLLLNTQMLVKFCWSLLTLMSLDFKKGSAAVAPLWKEGSNSTIMYVSTRKVSQLAVGRLDNAVANTARAERITAHV